MLLNYCNKHSEFQKTKLLIAFIIILLIHIYHSLRIHNTGIDTNKYRWIEIEIRGHYLNIK